MGDSSMANWHLSQILHFGLHFKLNLKGSKMGKEVKIPCRAQFKYGLIGSSAKTGKIFIGGSQEHFFGSKT